MDAALVAVALATASVFTISVSCEIWPCWARICLSWACNICLKRLTVLSSGAGTGTGAGSATGHAMQPAEF